MNFDTDPGLERFRYDVRRFFEKQLPEDIAHKVRRSARLSKHDVLRWQRILYDQGWAAPAWPKEEGGTGWSPEQQLVFEEERAEAGAPTSNYGTLAMLGPVLYTFGTAAQKRRHIPPILKGETYWCQGFSEPDAGSDLAALRTRAQRKGDHYLVTGRKIWTTGAHWADWIFMLVRTRTTGRKQDGISFLLADMKSPGISVRPIVSIDGRHHLNETVFEDVEVPAENLVGEENEGWKLAKFLLGNERAFGGADIPALLQFWKRLLALACTEQRGGTPLIQKPAFAQKLSDIRIQLYALHMLAKRVVSEGDKSSTAGWAMGSILKVRGTELQQRMTETMIEALGDYGPVWEPARDLRRDAGVSATFPDPETLDGIAVQFLYRRASTIYGGSNEVQRNIIARLKFSL